MNLKQWKKAKQLTNQELADLLQTTPGYVNHLVNQQRNKYPSLKMCLRIVEATKGQVTLADLRPEMAGYHINHGYTK